MSRVTYEIVERTQGMQDVKAESHINRMVWNVGI